MLHLDLMCDVTFLDGPRAAFASDPLSMDYLHNPPDNSNSALCDVEPVVICYGLTKYTFATAGEIPTQQLQPNEHSFNYSAADTDSGDPEFQHK